MILIYHIIEILDLADCDRGAVLGIVAFDSGFIGRTPVERVPLAFSRPPTQNLCLIL